MTFDELAQELDQAYSRGYTDREKTLRDFGIKHELDLRNAVDESVRTLVELVEHAGIGSARHWANFIREGMGIAYASRTS